MSKAKFVEELFKLYVGGVGNPLGIEHMQYFQETNGEEYVYVEYKGCSQQRFSVSGDSNMGILSDFVNFLNHRDYFNWLRDHDRKEMQYV